MELKPHWLVDLVDYIPKTIITRSIFQKKTGSVRISSFAAGEEQTVKAYLFDRLIQIIDGAAELIINDESIQLETGQIMIIPAHSNNKMRANEQFKMVSTLIKSGYEDVSI